MSESDPREIKPPEKHPKATAARSVVEAIVEELPGGSIATALGRTAFPPAEEKERDRWAGEVTDRVNEHDRALRGSYTVEIAGTTRAVAEWMARTSTDGLHEPEVLLEEAAAALGAQHPLAEVEEAAEELEGYGLVRLTRFHGGPLLSPTQLLFSALDPLVKGWKVEDDARTLAGIVLDMGESFSAHELEKRSGFERRRFNPALSKLLTMCDPDMVSDTIQPDYPAASAFVTPGTRVRLRRFVKGE